MDYLRACNPGVSVFSGPLNDPNVFGQPGVRGRFRPAQLVACELQPHAAASCVIAPYILICSLQTIVAGGCVRQAAVQTTHRSLILSQNPHPPPTHASHPRPSQVPPIAATDPEFDAIVVSEETIPGAEAINRTRAQLGFQPLIIAVVGLVASERRAVKLSSTDLRLLDAERAGRA